MKWLQFLLLITAWITVPFISKKTFFRFLPAATFVSLLLSIESELAKSKRWWEVKGNLIKGVTTVIPFVFGPFFVGSIWILKFTYGRFYLYTIVNVIIDSIFSFLISPLFEKLKLYELIKFTRKTVFWNFTLFSVLMYGYQMLIEKGFSSEKN